jgi:hypothetical protein
MEVEMEESVIIGLPREGSRIQADEQGFVDMPVTFSVSCPGESRLIEWGFEHDTKGECRIENFWSLTTTYRIKRGDWSFWVKDPGGPNAEVSFAVV